MNTDIRLSVDFFDHPKSMKLERRLGLEGVKALLQLWTWAARIRPDGDFFGMDEEDIELAAKWTGEEGRFISTLVALRWLDKAESGYRLHEWSEHNPWAAEAEDRSGSSRLSKLAQVNHAAWEECVRRGIDKLSPDEYQEWKSFSPADAGEKTATANDRNSAATANASATLAPSPSPSPEPKTEEKIPSESRPSPEAAAGPTPVSPAKPQCPHQAIAEAYNRILPQLPNVREMNESRKKKLRTLWGKSPERQSLEWWEDYFGQVAACPFLLGEGGKDWHAGFDWLIKPGNMTKVLEGQYKPKPGQGSSATKQRSTFNATRTLDLPPDCPFEYANLDEFPEYTPPN